MNSARESVLRWFVAFTVRFKRTDSTSESSNVNQSVVSISSTEGSEPGSPGAGGDHNRFSPARNKEYLQDASEVIRKALYSTKSNIRLLHEVLRQVWKKNYWQMCGRVLCRSEQDVFFDYMCTWIAWHWPNTDQTFSLLNLTLRWLCMIIWNYHFFWFIFLQGFLLPPKHLSTIRQVLLVYHEWLRVSWLHSMVVLQWWTTFLFSNTCANHQINTENYTCRMHNSTFTLKLH